MPKRLEKDFKRKSIRNFLQNNKHERLFTELINTEECIQESAQRDWMIKVILLLYI